jgi:hypothetical protein
MLLELRVAQGPWACAQPLNRSDGVSRNTLFAKHARLAPNTVRKLNLSGSRG